LPNKRDGMQAEYNRLSDKPLSRFDAASLEQMPAEAAALLYSFLARQAPMLCRSGFWRIGTGGGFCGLASCRDWLEARCCFRLRF